MISAKQEWTYDMQLQANREASDLAYLRNPPPSTKFHDCCPNCGSTRRCSIIGTAGTTCLNCHYDERRTR